MASNDRPIVTKWSTESKPNAFLKELPKGHSSLFSAAYENLKILFYESTFSQHIETLYVYSTSSHSLNSLDGTARVEDYRYSVRW